MGLSKVGRFSMLMARYDDEIEKHKREIIRLQRERVQASIEAKKIMDEELDRRRKARAGVAA